MYGGGFQRACRTATISDRGAAAAIGDSALLLDWRGDGRGYQRHDHTASPTV
ncbi:hypothetical protein ACFY04_41940 [Streptomyces sp. NPDC001549]|uniref:hypothetical protein n=1 Tax=Streptomyces sp. NPDC001549 TaxID=3364586 RepID=UPI0036774A8F